MIELILLNNFLTGFDPNVNTIEHEGDEYDLEMMRERATNLTLEFLEPYKITE